MAFEFGKRRRSRRSRRSRRKSMKVRVSRRRSRRSRKGRKGRRGGSSDAKKLFTMRVKKVQALMKTGMARKAAWKKVMSSRSFGVQVIPGF